MKGTGDVGRDGEKNRNEDRRQRWKGEELV